MEYIIIALLTVVIIILILIYFRSENKTSQLQIIELERKLSELETSLRNEFSINRTELNNNFKDSRSEAGKNIKDFSDTLSRTISDISGLQKNQLETFSNQLLNLTKTNEDKLNRITDVVNDSLQKLKSQINEDARVNRDELGKTMKSFEESFNNKMTSFSETLENRLKAIQEDNNLKLEKMRETVDEKLQTTLEKRLGESFKQVSERLELVHKGLGEMQNLAVGVGDIKKVLSNIKTKGVLGEYQLGNILDQLLTADQYSMNVKTKEGSNALVEFAVKLPGREDRDKTVWLPLDSKFPTEDYLQLLNAYEEGNPDTILNARKYLVKKIKDCAKDISDKYIDPPNTTDFGIMFLPFEGLFAEVLNNAGLFETIQREYKITITGPTTLSALLNSLQMGFRTLAIEKRSSEVWEILSAVKTDFGKFGDMLEKTKKKLVEATNTIDSAGVRTRAIERKLKDVQSLPAREDKEFLLNNGDSYTEADS
ncbi:MAG TPA: DNA recombination protein RmuC [Ignavibacteria bacterium]|nr:DNA recombination protein RmuC [Ignavibacteria bacterium]